MGIPQSGDPQLWSEYVEDLQIGEGDRGLCVSVCSGDCSGACGEDEAAKHICPTHSVDGVKCFPLEFCTWWQVVPVGAPSAHACMKGSAAWSVAGRAFQCTSETF